MKLLLLFVLPLSLLSQHQISDKFGASEAKSLLNSLTPIQREKAAYSFDDMSRYLWHYVPGSMMVRNGISLKDFDKAQKESFYLLLKNCMSAQGYKKTNDIMEVEYLLKELEPDNKNRIPENYFFSIYGNPEKDSHWAWKITGHHLSLNFTIINDELAYAPFFFGIYPAEIKDGEKKGMRILKEEEDLGFELINSMNEKQREIAIFNHQAFKEIVTTNASEVSPLEPVGILANELTASQKETLSKLIASYLLSMPEEIAKKRIERISQEDFGSIRFGWAGETVPGKPHYYRIQGKSFLVEFDNSQHNANHIHEVWRDFNGDYGHDLLREHYRTAGHKH